MKSRISDVGKVFKGMNIKKRLCEGVAVPTILYGAETWSMGIAGDEKNVMEMGFLRSMCGVTCKDQMRNAKWQSFSCGKIIQCVADHHAVGAETNHLSSRDLHDK